VSDSSAERFPGGSVDIKASPTSASVRSADGLGTPAEAISGSGAGAGACVTPDASMRSRSDDDEEGDDEAASMTSKAPSIRPFLQGVS
jgi:hypothetical protein